MADVGQLRRFRLRFPKQSYYFRLATIVLMDAGIYFGIEFVLHLERQPQNKVGIRVVRTYLNRLPQRFLRRSGIASA